MATSENNSPCACWNFGSAEALREKLQSRADAERRTLSRFIAHILERYLEESGKPAKRSPARK
jgi:hypothetical protein